LEYGLLLLIEKGHYITGTQYKSKIAGLKNTYKRVSRFTMRKAVITLRYGDISM